MIEKTKTFENLLEEVIERGLCGKCGGCYSFCSAGELNALKIGKNELPEFREKEKCLKCGICYLICPQTIDLEKEMKTRFEWTPPIGSYRKITSARTTDSEVMEVCTDGGVVTSLLVYLLDRKKIEGAMVIRRDNPFTGKAFFAQTKEEITSAAGTQYTGSYTLEELGKYSTYSPILPSIKTLEKKHLRNIAVVGTPCQINSIKKMQCLGIIPAHLIKYSIGLFCIGNFSLNESMRNRFEKKLKINLLKVKKLNIKDKMIITLNNGKIISIPLEKIEEFIRPACLYCSDFSNEYADISVGGLGSEDGYTTTLIRNRLGADLFWNAVELDYVEEHTYRRSKIDLMKKKMLSKIISFSNTKRQRAEKKRVELLEA